MKFTYLILNLFTFLPIIVFSFDKQLGFYRFWKYTLPGILGVYALFVIWDYYFTAWGVWQFNPAYVLDFRILGLPIEEHFFFLFTPFACLFIYEALGVYVKPDFLSRLSKPIALILIILMGLVAVSFTDRMYTLVNFGFGATVLLAAFIWMKKETLSLFWLAFLVHLVPFYIVNGILTSWPVLIYNDIENLGIRIGNIPLEDHAYSLILFLTNLWAYNWFKDKTFANASQASSND